MKSSISQIKNSVESLSYRLDQVEDTIPGLEDKEYVSEHADEDKEKKKLKKYQQNMQHL
jgi:hypothetical protein